jgi:hypothetical protein
MLEEVTQEEFSRVVRLHSGSLSLFPWSWKKTTTAIGTKTTTYSDYKKRVVAVAIHEKLKMDTRFISRYELETDIDSA